MSSKRRKPGNQAQYFFTMIQMISYFLWRVRETADDEWNFPVWCEEHTHFQEETSKDNPPSIERTATIDCNRWPTTTTTTTTTTARVATHRRPVLLLINTAIGQYREMPSERCPRDMTPGFFAPFNVVELYSCNSLQR